MIRGLLIGRPFYTAMLYIVAILLPFALHKLNLVTVPEFLVNPFWVFAILIIIMTVWLYPFLKPHWMSIFTVSFMVFAAFIYTYILYIL